MTTYSRIITVAVLAVLACVAWWLGRDVPLTPAHRPKPSAAARIEIIDRRKRTAG